MKYIKKITKGILYFLLIPGSFLCISLLLSAITVNRKMEPQLSDASIYLSTNGVHLDIIIPKKSMDSLLLSGLITESSDTYLAFGWGDENFYLHTPTWGDLTLKTAVQAMFLKSTTLMHVTRYSSKRSDWIEIKINEIELSYLNQYLQDSFKTTKNGAKLVLENEGYTARDNFYKANGSYSCFKTCNSWVNTGFKESGLKACLWTPFDFGLMRKYE